MQSTQAKQLNNLESFIIELRNQKVILDSHVAAIYTLLMGDRQSLTSA